MLASVLAMMLLACAAPGGSPGADAGGAKGNAAYYRAATPSGEVLMLEARISDADRAKGMMGRREAPAGTGMYFIFDHSAPHSFWMFDCLIPLDIVWLDEAHRVVYVAAGVPPCRRQPCPSYTPPAAARYVIEVAAGEATRLGLDPGASVIVSPVEEGR